MIVEYIKKMFENSFKKEWFDTYWVVDLHGTIIKPTYNGVEMEYYYLAKETLQKLTKRQDIKLILWTSSYPKEIKQYIKEFKKDNIHFDAINKNPNISSKNGNFGYYKNKFYFNVLIDDKAGFNPNLEWEEIYNFLKMCEISNYLPNPCWTTKY